MQRYIKWAIIVVGLIVIWAMLGCEVGGGFFSGRNLSPEKWDALNEFDLAAAKIEGSQEQELIDREAGRAMIRRFAKWVAGLSAGLFFISAVLLITGFVAKRTAVMGIVSGLSGIFIAYFLMVYGALVGEIVAWCILGVVVLVAVPYVLWTIYLFWRQRVAVELARKRANEGASAKDAILALPVSRKKKHILDEAWELLRTRTGPIRHAAEIEAQEILEKVKLPVPNPRS